jgi:hypothetical protein
MTIKPICRTMITQLAHLGAGAPDFSLPQSSKSQHTNDKQQIEPMLSELQALQDTLGKPDTLLADNGYFSKDNVQACVKQKITPLIALGREPITCPWNNAWRPMRRNLKVLTR